jgi:hypothetical protein
MRLLSLLLFTFIGTHASAVCLDNLPRQAPDSRFEIRGDTLLDHHTGLQWQRCPLGQEWYGEKSLCQLKMHQQRLFTWGEALIAATRSDIAGHQDWRLPNKNELDSIVDRACTGPAVNETVFPDTVFAGFWTSTPARHSDSYAWQIDFATGTLIALPVETQLSVRLVRTP